MSKVAEKAEKNQVHQDAIHVEHIKKEERNQALHTVFSINPSKKVHVLANNPTNIQPTDLSEKRSDFLEALKRARQSKKNPDPLTQEREAGWTLDPATPAYSLSHRFNFRRKSSDITRNK